MDPFMNMVLQDERIKQSQNIFNSFLPGRGVKRNEYD